MIKRIISGKSFSLQSSLMIRGLLAIVVLFIFLTPSFANAVMLKIVIQPKQFKEFFVTVNGITKPTINQEATFDIPEGQAEIEINNKKKIVKTISKPSKIQIYFLEE